MGKRTIITLRSEIVGVPITSTIAVDGNMYVDQEALQFMWEKLMREHIDNIVKTTFLKGLYVISKEENQTKEGK